jgi:hypothetical protein
VSHRIRGTFTKCSFDLDPTKGIIRASDSILVCRVRARKFHCFLAAVSTLGYGWYRAAITEMETSANKAANAANKETIQQVKRLLSEALAAGNRLIGQQAQKTEEQCEEDAASWARNTHNLIEQAYGAGEALLFLDNSGYVFYGDGSKESQTKNLIDGRMRRITELLRRTDTLAVRNEFDPTKF